MTMFAPAFTACCSTAIVAMDVVTIPLAMVDGSPAFTRVDASRAFHSTPMFFLMRSITSPAVMAGAPDTFVAGTNGAAAAAAARAANSRLDRSAM